MSSLSLAPRASPARPHLTAPARLVLFLLLPILTLACAPSAVPPQTIPTDALSSLDWQLPTADSAAPLGQLVSIYAILQDPRGIARADLVVDGILEHSVKLTVAARRFDFSYQWRPTTPGQHSLVLISYDIRDQPSAFPARTINVYGAPIVQPGFTPIIPPAVTPIIITATPLPPVFLIVTPVPPALPPPTFGTRAPNVITATPNLAPLLKKLTPTLTPTPVVIIVPFGQ